MPAVVRIPVGGCSVRLLAASNDVVNAAPWTILSVSNVCVMKMDENTPALTAALLRKKLREISVEIRLIGAGSAAKARTSIKFPVVAPAPR